MTQDKGEVFSRGMVVVAHADDAEYGCSGTVAKWCSEGWEVVYVLCTDGSKGSDNREMTQEKLRRIRRREQANAGKVLGLKDVAFLEHEDGMLEPSLDLRRDIAREIRRHRPDVVICQLPSRVLEGESRGGHPDHMAAGEATLGAVFPSARDHLTFPELLEAGFEPHKVAEIWIMTHPKADHWVDVTDHMDTSVKALLEHQSQMGDRSDQEIGKRMREWRRNTAEGKGMKFAEAFKRIYYSR